MEEIELAWGGDFSRMAEFSRELPIFDLELFERFKLADIETSAAAGRTGLLTEAANFPRKFETTARRSTSNQIDITRKRQFQAPNFAALRAQTNVCSPKKRGGRRGDRLSI
jgi:hypothetical protein